MIGFGFETEVDRTQILCAEGLKQAELHVLVCVCMGAEEESPQDLSVSWFTWALEEHQI